MASAQEVVNIALGEVGYSRWNDPEAGTKYGRWFAEVTGDSYYGQSGVPYCAMFASWCFCQAGASFPAYPSAYCPDIVNAAYSAGRTPYNEDAQPGDLVLFDWGHDGEADHVGIVVENHPESNYMVTVEGNTSDNSGGSQSNGGCVARKERTYDFVRCIVRPYFDESSNSDNSSDNYDDGGNDGGLDTDGLWGAKTTYRLQEFFGTDQDGVVSSQWQDDAWRHEGAPSFEHDYSGSGSQLIRAIQQKLNEYGHGLDEDGLCGEGTINALIDHFQNRSGATEFDGCFSYPSITIKAMQQALNEGTF